MNPRQLEAFRTTTRNCSITADAVKSGDIATLSIVQKLDYPIAIVARGADTLSLAALSLADALIRQFESVGSIISGNRSLR